MEQPNRAQGVKAIDTTHQEEPKCCVVNNEQCYCDYKVFFKKLYCLIHPFYLAYGFCHLCLDYCKENCSCSCKECNLEEQVRDYPEIVNPPKN